MTMSETTSYHLFAFVAMEKWMYLDSTGSLKGPIPTNILMRLLEKGINISGETTIWKEGMEDWEKMSEVCLLSFSAAFSPYAGGAFLKISSFFIKTMVFR
jgi:hypothetical protein